MTSFLPSSFLLYLHIYRSLPMYLPMYLPCTYPYTYVDTTCTTMLLQDLCNSSSQAGLWEETAEEIDRIQSNLIESNFRSLFSQFFTDFSDEQLEVSGGVYVCMCVCMHICIVCLCVCVCTFLFASSLLLLALSPPHIVSSSPPSFPFFRCSCRIVTWVRRTCGHTVCWRKGTCPLKYRLF